MSGKGSARRPTDEHAFGNSYDNIFRKKPEDDRTEQSTEKEESES